MTAETLCLIEYLKKTCHRIFLKISLSVCVLRMHEMLWGGLGGNLANLTGFI